MAIKNESNHANRVWGHNNMQVQELRGLRSYLTKMWRTAAILTIPYTKVNPANYMLNLITDYVVNPRNGIPTDAKSRSMARGNAIKELARDNMTWLVFCKAIRILNNIRRFRLVLEFDVDNEIKRVDGDWIITHLQSENDFTEHKEKQEHQHD